MHIKEITGDNNYNIKIGELYHKIFYRKLDIKKFREWYLLNPVTNVKEFGCFKKNTLVAYNYFMPNTYKNFTIYLSGGSMVDPRFKGVFLFFFQEIQNQIQCEKKSFIFYGFPNKNSFGLFTNKYGFNWKENKDYQIIKLKGTKYIHKENNFPFEHCNIDAININRNQLHFVKKNKQWLLWKLNKPNNNYKCLKYNNIYFIYKIFENSVDLISILNCICVSDYSFMLTKFYNYLFANNYKILNLIVSTKNLLTEIEKKFYFDKDNYERHFCYKSINNDVILNKETMFIEMIDSDVF